MYKIAKKDGKILVVDANDKVVYTSSSDGYIVYKSDLGAEVAKVSDMSDFKLLFALANVITFPNLA
ncbi:MAG: hypothetical protein ACLQFM_12065 [Terriglobales bacterium]|jgi:hypothetical protein